MTVLAVLPFLSLKTPNFSPGPLLWYNGKMMVLRTFWGVLGNQTLADFVLLVFQNFH
jgi:hypothetical protein